jgi:hypothetical protein
VEPRKEEEEEEEEEEWIKQEHLEAIFTFYCRLVADWRPSHFISSRIL